MKIIVGTKNKRKIAAVNSVVESLGITETFTVEGCDAVSDVSDTPQDEETKQGAINRAKNSVQCVADADMYIGIESGLAVRYGQSFEEVWVAVQKDGETFTAYSSGIVLPESVTKDLSSDAENHPEIMGALREAHGIDVHAEMGVDTWGNYTGNKIVREVGLEEAVRNALVQIFPGEKSFYNV